MNLYNKTNTGIKTAQGRKCDYFIVGTFSYDPYTNKVIQSIDFWRVKQDALDRKPANASRSVEYVPTDEQTVEDLIKCALTWDNKDTISGDTITLQGATIAGEILTNK